PWPPVLCRAGRDGLVLEAEHGGTAVRYLVAARGADGRVAFRADSLARFEARTAEPVTLQQVGPRAVRATWSDQDMTRVAEFDAVEPDKVPPFPDVPRPLTAMPDGFLAAL